jgi:hypothetical protein
MVVDDLKSDYTEYLWPVNPVPRTYPPALHSSAIRWISLTAAWSRVDPQYTNDQHGGKLTTAVIVTSRILVAQAGLCGPSGTKLTQAIYHPCQ